MSRLGSRARSFVLTVSVGGLLLGGSIRESRAGDFVEGFEDVVIASGFLRPTTMAMMREKLFLVGEKGGDIWIVHRGQKLPTPLLSLPVTTEGEGGVNGIALAPETRRQGDLFVHYTFAGPPVRNRLSRFTVHAMEGVGPEEVLIDGMPADSNIHNSGCIRFSLDGTLFFTAGDGGRYPQNARDLSNLGGKILRINPDGSVPEDNPFAGVAGVRGEIWAYGFRNPWRFAIDPESPRIFLNDVGSAFWEEVNHVRRGEYFGWPNREGPGSSNGSLPPLVTYAHNGEGAAITGGAFYRGVQYPSEFEGNYFYADFVKSTMRRMVVTDNGTLVSDEEFGTQLGGPVDLITGPGEKLFYISYTGGRIRRIDYVGDANRRPVLDVEADPSSGLAPVEVTFSTAASYDPDDDPLSFHYDFDDGETLDTVATEVTHTFTEARNHDVTVSASDGRGGMAQRTVSINAANEPPVPVIAMPADGLPYAAGDVVAFAGSAIDAEDGPLPEERLSWTITFHHNTHTHPFIGPLNGVAAGTFTIPRTGEVDTDVSYEVRLDAVDLDGVSASTCVFVLPRLTTFRLETVPPGLTVLLDAQPFPTPLDVGVVVGFLRQIEAPVMQEGPGGESLGFVRWADSPMNLRTVEALEGGRTFTALYREAVREE